MTLKEFAEIILNNSDLWNYYLCDGIINLDNDIQDESYLHVHHGTIELLDCYVDKNRLIK